MNCCLVFSQCCPLYCGRFWWLRLDVTCILRLEFELIKFLVKLFWEVFNFEAKSTWLMIIESKSSEKAKWTLLSTNPVSVQNTSEILLCEKFYFNFSRINTHKAYIFNNLITRNSCERHYRIFIAEVKGKPLKIRLKRGVSFTFLQPIIVVRDWTQRGNDIVAFHPNSDEKHGTWILSVIYGIMRQGVIRFSNYAVRRTTATEKNFQLHCRNQHFLFSRA